MFSWLREQLGLKSLSGGGRDGRFNEADLALREGRYLDAALLFRELATELSTRELPFENHTDRVRLHRLGGSAYAEAGEFDEAVEEFIRALRLAPRDPQIYYGLSWCYFQLGELDDADNYVCQTLQLEDRQQLGMAMLARVAEARCNYTQALAAIRDFIGSLAPAERDSVRVQTLFPRFEPDPEALLPEMLRLAARSSLYLDLSAEALAWTDELLKWSPGDTEGMWIRGNALLRQDDDKGAEEAFRIAAQHYAPGALELARLNHWLRGDLVEAERWYDDYHRRVASRESRLLLADFYLENNRYREALAIMGPLEPDDRPLDWLNRAECLLMVGNHRESCRILDRYFAEVDWSGLDPLTEPDRAAEFFRAMELQAGRFIQEERLDEAVELLTPLLPWAEYRPELRRKFNDAQAFRSLFSYRLLIPRSNGEFWLARFRGIQLDGFRRLSVESMHADPVWQSSLPLGIPLEASDVQDVIERTDLNQAVDQEFWNLLEFHHYVHPGADGEGFRRRVERLRTCQDQEEAESFMIDLAAVFLRDCQKLQGRAGNVLDELRRGGLQGWNVFDLVSRLAEIAGENWSGILGNQGPVEDVLPQPVPLTTRDEPSFLDAAELADWIAEREDHPLRLIRVPDPVRCLHRLIRPRSAMAPLHVVVDRDRIRRRLQKLAPRLLLGRDAAVDFLDDLVAAPCLKRLRSLREAGADPRDTRFIHWVSERLRKGDLGGLFDDAARFARAGGMTNGRLNFCLQALRPRDGDCGGCGAAEEGCPRQEAVRRLTSTRVLISSGRVSPEILLAAEDLQATGSGTLTPVQKFQTMFLHFRSWCRSVRNSRRLSISSLEMLAVVSHDDPARVERCVNWLQRFQQLISELAGGWSEPFGRGGTLLDWQDARLIPATLAREHFPDWHRRVEERLQDGLGLFSGIIGIETVRSEMEQLGLSWREGQHDLFLVHEEGMFCFYFAGDPQRKQDGIIISGEREATRLSQLSPEWWREISEIETWLETSEKDSSHHSYNRESLPMDEPLVDWIRELPLEFRSGLPATELWLKRDLAAWLVTEAGEKATPAGHQELELLLKRTVSDQPLPAMVVPESGWGFTLAWQRLTGSREISLELQAALEDASAVQPLLLQAGNAISVQKLGALLAWRQARKTGQRQVLLAADWGSVFVVMSFLRFFGIPFPEQFLEGIPLQNGEWPAEQQGLWLLDMHRTLPGAAAFDSLWSERVLRNSTSLKPCTVLLLPFIQGTGIAKGLLPGVGLRTLCLYPPQLRLEHVVVDDRVDQAHKVVRLLGEHGRSAVAVPAAESAVTVRALRARNIRLHNPDAADGDPETGWRIYWREGSRNRRESTTRLILWKVPDHPVDLLSLLGRTGPGDCEVIILHSRRGENPEPRSIEIWECRVVHDFFLKQKDLSPDLSLLDLASLGLLPEDRLPGLPRILQSLVQSGSLKRNHRSADALRLHWSNRDVEIRDSRCRILADQLLLTSMEGLLDVQYLKRTLGITIHDFIRQITMLERTNLFRIEGELNIELKCELSALQQDVLTELEARQSILSALAEGPGFMDGFEYLIQPEELHGEEWSWLRELFLLAQGGVLRVETAAEELRVFRKASSTECRAFLRREEADRRLLIDVLRNRCRFGQAAVFTPSELNDRMEQAGSNPLDPVAVKYMLLRWQRLGLLNVQLPPLWRLEGLAMRSAAWAEPSLIPPPQSPALLRFQRLLTAEKSADELLGYLAGTATDSGSEEKLPAGH